MLLANIPFVCEGYICKNLPKCLKTAYIEYLPASRNPVLLFSEIVEIFNDFLAQTKMGTKVVFVTGIYVKTAKQSYGVFYDTLKDQNSDQSSLCRSPRPSRPARQRQPVTLGGNLPSAREPGNIQPD